MRSSVSHLAIEIAIVFIGLSAMAAVSGLEEVAQYLGLFCTVFVALGYVLVFGGNSLPVIFLAISSVYFSSGAVDYLFFENSRGNEAGTGTSLVLIGNCLFLLLYPISSRYSVGLTRLQTREEDHWIVSRLGILKHGGVLLVVSVCYFAISLRDFSSVTSRYEIFATKSVVHDLLKTVFPVVAITLYAHLKARAKVENVAALVWLLFWLAVVVFAGVEILLYGDRRRLLLLLLALLLLSQVEIRAKALLALAAAASFLLIFGFVRSKELAEWASVLSRLDFIGLANPAMYDPKGFLDVANSLLKESSRNINFPGYLESMLILVPKSIFPGRPLTPEEWYVATYYPEIFHEGGGKSFNILVEAYKNLSILAPVFLAFVYVIIYRVIFATTSNVQLSAALFVYIASVSMRMSLAGLFKFALIVIAVHLSTIACRRMSFVRSV